MRASRHLAAESGGHLTGQQRTTRRIKWVVNARHPHHRTLFTKAQTGTSDLVSRLP